MTKQEEIDLDKFAVRCRHVIVYKFILDQSRIALETITQNQCTHVPAPLMFVNLMPFNHSMKLRQEKELFYENLMFFVDKTVGIMGITRLLRDLPQYLQRLPRP